MLIRLVAFDIDGVITSGKVTVDRDGRETKSIDYRDIDAIFHLKRTGYTVALITAENSDMAAFFGRRFDIEHFYSGVQDKRVRLEEIAEGLGIPSSEVCYVGDSAKDAAAIAYAGLGACPANATQAAIEAADIQLSRRGGDGAVAELVAEIERRQNSSEMYTTHNKEPRTDTTAGLKPPCFMASVAEHLETVKALSADPDLLARINAATAHVGSVLKSGGKILLCGNGGSAADSQHIAAEFVGKFKALRRALPAEALTVNTSSLTAIGNDFAFEEIFSRQVEAIGAPGDLLWGISTSGGSKNVLAALQVAKAQGLSTLMMTGSSSDQAKLAFCDHVIAVPSASTPRIQEMHILIAHSICEDAERLFVTS